MLSTFLVGHYVTTPDRARRVVLPFQPCEPEALALALPESRFSVPQRGVAGRWLELADQNARHLLESLRMESFETDERSEDPVYSLGRERA